MDNDVGDLKPAGYNPRKITDKKLTRLGDSMFEFGDLSGIVKNVRTGNLVGGHQRVKHFDPSWPITKNLHMDKTGTVGIGYVETPTGNWSYREVDWSEAKEKAANLAANKHGGEFDEEKLSGIIAELAETDINLDLTGFDKEEFDKIINASSGNENSSSGDGSDTFSTTFEVAVECKDESEQEEVYNLLTEKGYKCRILTL